MSKVDGSILETASRSARAEESARSLKESGEAIFFDSGHAFPEVLPDLREEAMAALSMHRAETLQYAPRPGLPELRTWISEYMTSDGVPNIAPDHVLVVNGAKHGLELICRALLHPGDSIVVTAPTYFTAIPIFKSFGVNFIEIPQDENGLKVDELQVSIERLMRDGRPMPKFIYDVPDFHNPTGITMSCERRKALIDLAAMSGIAIVEDSPYRRVRFEGQSQPTLKALDRTNNVLTLGTFSKLLAPGLRIGWIAASPDLLARILPLKSDGGSCPLTQRLILEFCRAGRLDPHCRNVQQTYRLHRDRMFSALRREVPEIRTALPSGGYYLWLTLPPGIDGDEVAKRAALEGVVVLAGSKFFASSGYRPPGEGPPRNNIRVAYSHASLEQIDEGVARLGRAFRAVKPQN